MPDIHATREANCTSQAYNSFPFLACVRGFAPGLYALGLSCTVHRLEIGSMSPPRVNASGAWSGVSELVVRVEEPGRWKHVTNDLLIMTLPLANTLTTFVLHWDRTSVPFDRASSDDDQDDYQFPPPSPSASSPSRTERLALTVAEQMPALRCVLVEIPHDSRRRPYQFTFDSLAQSNPPRLSSTPSGNGNGAADDGQRRYERRFWRIDGSEEFLCVEPLTDAAARRLMDAEGLSFEDRVRYW